MSLGRGELEDAILLDVADNPRGVAYPAAIGRRWIDCRRAGMWSARTCPVPATEMFG
jgi:hypothetical protein